MTRVERAKCDNCGFEEPHILLEGLGITIRKKYSCLKCKKIVTDRRSVNNCKECGSTLIKTYKEHPKDGYHICPKCGERKLMFYVGKWPLKNRDS